MPEDAVLSLSAEPRLSGLRLLAGINAKGGSDQQLLENCSEIICHHSYQQSLKHPRSLSEPCRLTGGGRGLETGRISVASFRGALPTATLEQQSGFLNPTLESASLLGPRELQNPRCCRLVEACSNTASVSEQERGDVKAETLILTEKMPQHCKVANRSCSHKAKSLFPLMWQGWAALPAKRHTYGSGVGFH